jgi:DNA repair exonuclease SbcCD ATPase subunit
MPGITMNGTRARQASFSSTSEPRYGAGLQGVHPGAKVLVDGYNGSLHGANDVYLRYDSVCDSNHSTIYRCTNDGQLNRHEPPQRSPLLNMDDPVAMHLLMETAMDDSQQFHVLSYEELDAMKKELSILTTRIDGTKRKLVLETKLRDAAQSLNRLQDPTSLEFPESSPKQGKRHRRSMMGGRGSFSDMLNKTDDELAVSTRKCEDLAQELWQLEKRAETLQTVLLEHTAGVLQKTHKGYLEKESPTTKPDGVNGHLMAQRVPNFFDFAHDFDDRSFYETLDALLDPSGVQTHASKEPLKENFAQYDQAILETERRLEDFNARLRDSIAQLSLQNGAETVPPVRGVEDGHNRMTTLNDQLNYLERSFSILQENRDVAAQDKKRSLYATEEQLGELNIQLRSIITRGLQGQSSEYPLPPEVSGKGPDSQVGYLESGLDVVEQTIQQLIEDNRAMSSVAASAEEANHYKTVLLGLWEILVGGEEDLRRQDPLQREASHEEFSLQVFSNKVQTLFARASGLQEQKEFLARQVQQQREVNTQSDSAKDGKISDMTLELEQSRKSVANKEREAQEARDSLALMTERVDVMQQEASLLEQQKGINENKALAAEQEARRGLEEQLFAELSEKQSQLSTLESELAETKDDLRISNAEMLGRLEESEKRFQALNSGLKVSVTDREKSQNDMQDLEGQLVLLQTELTVAKAELDAAYGTRAERAAEATAHPVKQQEFDELTARNKLLTEELEGMREGNADTNQRMQTLQRELTETIGEYDTMTQSTIAFEREREQLENIHDTLRDRCESLETQLSEEKVRWLGVNSPGSGRARDSMSPGTTSTQVLKNEFKKMIRDTRAENMRALRVS